MGVNGAGGGSPRPNPPPTQQHCCSAPNGQHIRQSCPIVNRCVGAPPPSPRDQDETFLCCTCSVPVVALRNTQEEPARTPPPGLCGQAGTRNAGLAITSAYIGSAALGAAAGYGTYALAGSATGLIPGVAAGATVGIVGQALATALTCYVSKRAGLCPDNCVQEYDPEQGSIDEPSGDIPIQMGEDGEYIEMNPDDTDIPDLAPSVPDGFHVEDETRGNQRPSIRFSGDSSGNGVIKSTKL